MRRARASCAALALVTAFAGLAAPARASDLAYAVVTTPEDAGQVRDPGAARPLLYRGDRPILVLAQRAIERSWGPSEDSIYVEHEVKGWRSEGLALSLSAIVPGAGQVYAGENTRGMWFALAEATGWVTRQFYRHRGGEIRDAAARFVGSPQDSTSAWSFARWSHATGGDASDLQALWVGDRDAFYQQIADDPRYLDGWGGDAAVERQHFDRLREISDDRLRFARYAGMALWIDHLTAAVDALRAARNHNLPLLPRIGLRIRSDWRRGRPGFVAVVERKF